LTCTDNGFEAASTIDSEADATCKKDRYWYEENLRHFRAKYHSQCLFNRKLSIVPELRFEFDDFGLLHGEFMCNGDHQGYDFMVHGGIIAALIDASMAQCLMGHGVLGYTTDLSVKYRKPVKINTMTRLETAITEVKCKLLYFMCCTFIQGNICVVKSEGKFFKVK
jgi:hypothetical protein